MGTLKSNTTHKMQKSIIAAILFFVTITNASPLVQNKQLVDAETAIRTQLTNFFESENVENAKDKAKQVSDKIVKIFDDSRLTVQEKSQQVRSAIEEAVGKVNKENADAVVQKILAKASEVYLPYLEAIKNNDFVQKGWGWVNDILGKMSKKSSSVRNFKNK